MSRPLRDSEYIFGLHDPGGEHIMLASNRPGWVLFTEKVGRDPNDRNGKSYLPWADRGLGVMARLNHGYEPEGTIPLSRHYQDFARRCANYVAASTGCHHWIIGNEMNFVVERPTLQGGRRPKPQPATPPLSPDEPPPSSRERPDRFNVLHPDAELPQTRSSDQREVITPQLYARCYRLCREAIRGLPGHANDLVLVGAVAPWNNQTQYEGNANGDWVQYFVDILKLLGPDACDGFTLHSYTHGDDPNLIFRQDRLDPPFHNYHYHFLAYRDFLNAVPANMRHLPAYITETDQDVAWRNENRGWVQRAYGEIDWWNSQPGYQQIRALILYRWPKHDKWYIEGKEGVIEDFRQAMKQEYRWREMVKPPVQRPPYRAVFLEGGGLKTADVGQILTTSFKLRNDGSRTWPKAGPNPVRIGFHWESNTGQPLAVPAKNDFRTSLPNDVPPGATVLVEGVRVGVPDQPGALRLRWDLVEEGITWFSDQDSAEKIETVLVKAVAPPSEVLIPETGKRVKGPFLEWYRRYGLDVTGYPHGEQFLDPATGLQTQIFQRVIMEEFEPGRIRLRLAGQDLAQAHQQIRQAEEDIRRLTAEAQRLAATIASLQQQLRDRPPGGEGSTAERIAPPEVVDIATQLPRDGTGFARRQPSAIRTLVINHTGGAADIPVETIAGYHRQRGYPGIAYHYLVAPDGTIFQTNPWTDTVSDRGYLGEGLNLALAGKFDEIAPGETQLKAAAHLCAWLLQELTLTPDAIRGVSELAASGSPGWQWLHGQQYKTTLLAAVAAVPTVSTPVGDAEADQLRAMVADLQSQLSSRKEQLATLQAEVTGLRQELQDRAQRIGDLDGQVTRLAAQVATQQAEIARLKDQLARPQPTPPGPVQVSQPAIHDVVDQLPRHPTLRYSQRRRDKITHLCIHHSATPATISLERIAEYHTQADPSRKKDPWPGIGYHFYVKPDGTIYQTNREETVSYHVAMNNNYTVGICVGGDFTRAVPTQQQVDGAAHLVAWLMQELKIPEANIKGHKEFPQNDTSCPGVQWLDGQRWKDTLLAGVRARQSQPGTGQALKSLFHYVLFWQKPDAWAREDWYAAEKYVERFRPTMGFSVDDARNAQHVTIVGGVAGVSYEGEELLRAAGCQVERLAGADFAETKRMLDDLAQSGQRFLSRAG